MKNDAYICIDLKSFYASVECVERGLDPFKQMLVVADPARGSGAICLAVSPALRAIGIPGRCRIYEIPAGLRYITAKPRMRLYMQYSADIYSIYLRYFAAEDIHVYSVDECFIYVTPYLGLYRCSPEELAKRLMDAVFREKGICATAGVGTNLFLAKVAMDIIAKHSPDHIGILDAASFRERIQHHMPITDIWGIGKGTARRLERMGAFDLYDVTQIDERRLLKEFGVNARNLIDHANGREPCTMKDIHDYVPKTRSLSNSQVFFEDYSFEDALTPLKEMVDGLVLELVGKELTAGGISLFVGYSNDAIRPSGGSRRLSSRTDSLEELLPAFEELFWETANRELPIRRIGICLGDVGGADLQLRLFDMKPSEEKLRERRRQRAVLEIKRRYGKNAVIKAMSLLDKATATTRNGLVGGHSAG